MTVFRTILVFVFIGLLVLPGSGFAEPSPGKRSEQEIAALDEDAVAQALIEDRMILIYALGELHRRYPDQVEAPDMTGVPAPDAGVLASLAAAPEDKLLEATEAVSAEVDRLLARGQALAAGETRAGPMSTPQAPAKPAAQTPEEYCYAMYGKAYALCESDDRSCKMIAANDWGLCKQSGRWP